MRKMLFLGLTSLMFLTAFSRPPQDLGWWKTGLKAPELETFPEVITAKDSSVKIMVSSEEKLIAIEISLNAGYQWIPISYIPDVKVHTDQDLQVKEITLPLGRGYLESLFSHEMVMRHNGKMRSILLRGINSEGLKTPPRSLILVYKRDSSPF